MEKERSKRISPPGGGGAMTAAIALLLVVCLADCATEQRINSRGSKASKLFEKVNGWRSQRGGSCLSYGHSCWGAHGKRSGNTRGAAPAPDWFLDKLFRPADNDNSDLRHTQAKSDISAIFEGDAAVNSPSSGTQGLNNGELPAPARAAAEIVMNRNPEAKPMLDEELLSKIKLWQIMKEAAEE